MLIRPTEPDFGNRNSECAIVEWYSVSRISAWVVRPFVIGSESSGHGAYAHVDSRSHDTEKKLFRFRLEKKFRYELRHVDDKALLSFNRNTGFTTGHGGDQRKQTHEGSTLDVSDGSDFFILSKLGPYISTEGNVCRVSALGRLETFISFFCLFDLGTQYYGSDPSCLALYIDVEGEMSALLS